MRGPEPPSAPGMASRASIRVAMVMPHGLLSPGTTHRASAGDARRRAGPGAFVARSEPEPPYLRPIEVGTRGGGRRPPMRAPAPKEGGRRVRGERLAEER